MARRNERRDQNVTVAVAIDKDKGSQYALKWAIDHLMSKGQSISLVHVKTKPSSVPTPAGQPDNLAKEVFLPFRCFCSRKDITSNEIILEDTDIAKALLDYLSSSSIETIVLGAPTKGGFVRRFRSVELTTTISRGAPDHCTVYVIGKGKITSVRSATATPPAKSQPPAALLLPQPGSFPETIGSPSAQAVHPKFRGLPYDYQEYGRLSAGSDYDTISLGSSFSGNKSLDFSPQIDCSTSFESGRTSLSSQNMDDVEAEMRRLKQELKQTMDMYSAAIYILATRIGRSVMLHTTSKHGSPSWSLPGVLLPSL